MGIKSMERRFKCKYCNKSYAMADALVTHEKKCLREKIAMEKYIKEKESVTKISIN